MHKNGVEATIARIKQIVGDNPTYLTFDIEIWCNGWNDLDRVFPASFERYVYGHSAHGDYALPKTLELRVDGPLPRGADVGEAHAVGREHARQRVHEYRIHVEGIGNETSVLSAGAAEARERVAADVVAALHGNLPDGVRHVIDCDPQEPERQLGGVRGLAGGGTDIPGQFPEADGDAQIGRAHV